MASRPVRVRLAIRRDDRKRNPIQSNFIMESLVSMVRCHFALDLAFTSQRARSHDARRSAGAPTGDRP